MIDENLGLTATEISVRVKSPVEKVHWFLIGDAHIGHASFDRKAFDRLKANILRTAKTAPCAITFMGDMFDSIIVGDKRYSPAEQNSTLTSAEIRFYAWLKPLLNHKNITFNGFLYGNHEMTLVKKGVNSILQIQDKTNGKIQPYGNVTHNIIKLKCGKIEMKLRSVLTHKSSNKKTQASLEKYAEDNYLAMNKKNAFVRIRIVAAAHTHDLICSTHKVAIYQSECKKTRHDSIYVCRTGSFLKQGYGSPNYAVEAGHPGKPVGYIEVVFSMQKAEGEGDAIKVYERFNGDIDPEASVYLDGEI